MRQSAFSLEDVVGMVADPRDDYKPVRIVKEAKDGVKKGRPPKGSPRFQLFDWLDKERKDQYERASQPSDAVLKLKCLICKAIFAAGRETTNHFVFQHEESDKHKEAITNADGSSVLCVGVLMNPDSGPECASSLYTAVSVWSSAGMPWMTSSIKHESYVGEGCQIMVRSEVCKRESHNCRPGRTWCVHCEKLVASTSFREKVCRWAYRILLVDLVHATLTESEATRESLLQMFQESEWLQSERTGFDALDLRPLTYDLLYEHCKLKISHVPKNLCNPAGVQFIESRFAWLSNKLSFVGGPHAETLKSFAQALMNGSLPAEVRIAKYVMQGTLRADAVLKTLVTSMVLKCTRQGAKRVGSNSLLGVEEAEMAETGFALAA